MTIDDLLSESVAAARKRELTAFGDSAGPLTNRIVLFGAGMLGRKTARALKNSGVKPLGFIDNNPQLQGMLVEGIEVFTPSAAAERWRDSALFVITIFHPTADRGMASRVEFLGRMGCIYITSFLSLAWSLDGVLPHYAAERPSRLLAQADDLKTVASFWSDKKSTEVFRQQLLWRLKASFSETGDPAPNQYFPKNLIKPHPQERFVDGGAYDGDTLRAMPWPMERAWAIEPDPNNVSRLNTEKDHCTTVHQTALGEERGSIRFNAAGTMASARSAEGDLDVEVTRLDDLLSADTPTFIKLDIEGDELLALKGGRRLLERTQAVLAVCVYHRPEDLWTIPMYLKQSLPNHHFALRSHAYDGFELVAYAIPRNRWAGGYL